MKLIRKSLLQNVIFNSLIEVTKNVVENKKTKNVSLLYEKMIEISNFITPVIYFQMERPESNELV